MRVKVWDFPTRIFHWSLVASVGVCVTTGFFLPSRWFGWHITAGYVICGLLLFRLTWAFCGPEHSRAAGFLPRPSAVLGHLKAIAQGHPPHTVGHNPAGGAMVLALLAVLILLAVSGLTALGGLDKQGPLASLVSFAEVRTVREWHELLAYGLLGLAGVHVLGVLVESRLVRQSLILTMITGYKRVPDDTRAPTPAPLGTALTTLGLVGLAVTAGVALLDARPIPGWRAVDAPPSYAKECGACHMAYHPSLLPAASWDKVMTSLDNHFGEDASLPAAAAQPIAAWLAANAAETWDTKPANLLRTVAADEPRRMTQTPWWKRKHRHIPDAVFMQKTVKMRGNCAACHQDAQAGTFRVQAIHIPNP